MIHPRASFCDDRVMDPVPYAPSEPAVPPVDPEVVKEVHAELVLLRKARGQFSMAKFSQFPHLVRVCGEGDLVEAFVMFRREIERYSQGDKYEAAAALSISAPAETVLERFTLAAEAFDYQDQRTIRRWSDDGLKRIAEDLVAIANVRGRLGKELLTLTLEGDMDTGLELVIDQMDFTQLPSQAPQVTMWLWQDEENATEALLDLENAPHYSAANEIYRNTRLRISLPMEQLQIKRAGRLLTVAVQGRAAPSRTVVWTQTAQLPSELHIEVTTHRTMVMMEVSKKVMA